MASVLGAAPVTLDDRDVAEVVGDGTAVSGLVLNDGTRDR
jgi:hypothetical protein